LASVANDGIMISTSGFLLRIYKLNICELEKNGFFRCIRKWLWNTHV